MIIKKLLQYIGLCQSRKKGNKHVASTASVVNNNGIAIKSITVNRYIIGVEIKITQAILKLISYLPLVTTSNLIYYKYSLNKYKDELDLTNEKKYMLFIKDKLSYIKVPEVYYADTNKMYSEYIEGELLKDADTSRLDIYKIYEDAFKVIFDYNFIHGDLHAGNFLVKDNSIYLIDFANSAFITNHSKRIMYLICYGLITKDPNIVYTTLKTNRIIDKRVTRSEFIVDCNKVIYEGLYVNNLDTTQLANAVIEMVNKYKIEVPADLVLIFTTIFKLIVSLNIIDKNHDMLGGISNAMKTIKYNIVRQRAYEITRDFMLDFLLQKEVDNE